MIPLLTFSLKNESVGDLKLHKIFLSKWKSLFLLIFKSVECFHFLLLFLSVENKSHDLLVTNRN